MDTTARQRLALQIVVERYFDGESCQGCGHQGVSQHGHAPTCHIEGLRQAFPEAFDV